MLYYKPGRQPGGYTVLNFGVENIEKVVENLTAKGIEFEKIESTRK